jgi:glutamate dehydrogenase/leucine dehydrogenase
MKDILKRYEEKAPEIVFEWSDPESEATGFCVINSLRGGAAGGGTRMRKGLDRKEVESLAKTMEIKFTVSGPAIGGAKSGINFDPHDPRKKGVLERWFKAVNPLLKTYYGTGGDLNVDEIHEVFPITEKNGLLHPQEGVVNGHFHANEEDKKQRIEQLNIGVKKIVEDKKYTPSPESKLRIADLITGFGVAESVKHFYALNNIEIKGKKVIIQGWGNVGAAAGYYLTQDGAIIVGIIDRSGGLIKQEGFSFDEIKDLFINSRGANFHSLKLIPFDEINQSIWNLNASVFIPAAASRLVTKQQVESLINSGLEVIACGANVPFNDNDIFFGSIMSYADSKVSLIPDFIANCGMARVFAYLMNTNIELTDKAIFEDASAIIYNALKEIHKVNKTKVNISHTAFEIAIKQLN